MVIVGGACCLGCRHTTPSPVMKYFPVICTAAIPVTSRTNLEHLKDVPVPEIVKFGGVTCVNSAGKDVVVTTWREFIAEGGEKRTEKTGADLDMSGWFWRTRGHIPFIEIATPATNSFVRNLKPGQELVRLLPLTLAPLLSEESNDVAEAIKQHQSWLQFYPETRITKQTDTEMSLNMDRFSMQVTILAYGDFNHDGFDDMLVYYDQGVTDGTFAYSGVAVLTRTNASAPLESIP